MPLKEQQGPEQGTADILEQMGSKDVATELTNYDWELFTAMHEVRISDVTTACTDIDTGSFEPNLSVEVLSVIVEAPPMVSSQRELIENVRFRMNKNIFF